MSRNPSTPGTAQMAKVMKGAANLASQAAKVDFSKMQLRDIMRYHAFTSICLGFATLILPHTFLMEVNDSYSHYSHEFIRLYGCMTLAIGWVVWKSQGIKDGRLARALTETFCVSYGLQSLVMLRAQFTNPTGHTVCKSD